MRSDQLHESGLAGRRGNLGLPAPDAIGLLSLSSASQPITSTLVMAELVGNVLVGQSGGPTSVINASVAGIVNEALNHECIEEIYGACGR